MFYKGIELRWPLLIGDIAWDHFMSGEFELGIAAQEDFVELNGADPAEIRQNVDGATHPETGKKYLDELINRWIAESENPTENHWPYRMYLLFGYVDDYWEIVKDMETDTLGPWKGGFDLRWRGTVSGGQKFRSHPYYITPEKIELWDFRGAPDTCSKSSGQWVCN